MKRVFLAAAIAALAACAVTTGGSGQMTDGSGVIATIHGDPAVGRSDIALSSPKGWVCNGSYSHKAGLGANKTVNVPLTCTDGRTGNGILVFEEHKLVFTMAFSLSNGEQGNVVFSFR